MHPSAPRLAPIEKPRSLFVRLAERISQRQFGRVISPMRVIYARKPALLAVAALIQRTMEKEISLDPALRLLIQVQVSRVNGCAFCEDLALAQAVREKVGAERFAALEGFRESDRFSEREKAALAFTEENVRDRNVSDETFAAARRCFTETEIVEIAWVAAAESYFNLQAHPLGIGSDSLADLARRAES